MRYGSPEALNQAIKSAAIKSPLETDKAIHAFFFDRFLCRVFNDKESAFVLKGGQNILARNTVSRATRDIDLLYQPSDLESAVEMLIEAVSIDLNDYITFRHQKTSPIVKEQSYREGVTLTFTPFLGVKEKSTISVDLVVDEASCVKPDTLHPKNRLPIEGIITSPYLLYPAVNIIADKICATMQLYLNGQPSSRVKDLVDLVKLLNTESFLATELREQIELEYTHLRKLGDFCDFFVPRQWKASPYALTYQRLATEAHVLRTFPTVDSAEALVNSCVGELPQHSGMCWEPAALCWEQPKQQI